MKQVNKMQQVEENIFTKAKTWKTNCAAFLALADFSQPQLGQLFFLDKFDKCRHLDI